MIGRTVGLRIRGQRFPAVARLSIQAGGYARHEQTTGTAKPSPLRPRLHLHRPRPLANTRMGGGGQPGAGQPPYAGSHPSLFRSYQPTAGRSPTPHPGRPRPTVLRLETRPNLLLRQHGGLSDPRLQRRDLAACPISAWHEPPLVTRGSGSSLRTHLLHVPSQRYWPDGPDFDRHLPLDDQRRLGVPPPGRLRLTSFGLSGGPPSQRPPPAGPPYASGAAPLPRLAPRSDTRER